ncbi:MAG: cysteine desulfurase-like protein [Acidimicrobiia bacterium]|nr:cysteine desulfurase-like protein [Acidimicrobiia bacterium]
MAFDPTPFRAQFPAFDRRLGDRPAIYLDGPGGTQAPEMVIDAMAGVLRRGISNHDGPFAPSRESGEIHHGARVAMADLFNAQPNEIAFGQNMTSLTLSVSRALGKTWGPGDEIVVTRLDHDANVWPWVIAAEESGATIRYADFDPDNGWVVTVDRVREVLSDRTRLVAFTHASNAIGSITDVAAITAAAHEVGAQVFVDAVHYAPHGPVDVAATGCDFLVASSYKFFGPHTGVFYGRHEALEALDAVKIRPAPDDAPGKFETGTQSFESLAGVIAAIEYLASLGTHGEDRRSRLRSAMEISRDYEASLSTRFLAGLAEMPGVTLYGIDTAAGRTPTFAIDVAGMSADEVSSRLGEVGIFTWAGHYYALEVMDRIGKLDSGGLVRIGFVHTTTTSEVDVTLEALDRLAAGHTLDGLPVPG